MLSCVWCVGGVCCCRERNAVVSARLAELREAEVKQKVHAAAEAVAQKQAVQHPKGQEGFIPFYSEWIGRMTAVALYAFH